eukprot:COSAG02_NODE_1863_length_10608_cov_128.518508_10_plen_231_part_00
MCPGPTVWGYPPLGVLGFCDIIRVLGTSACCLAKYRAHAGFADASTQQPAQHLQPQAPAIPTTTNTHSYPPSGGRVAATSALAPSSPASSAASPSQSNEARAGVYPEPRDSPFFGKSSPGLIPSHPRAEVFELTVGFLKLKTQELEQYRDGWNLEAQAGSELWSAGSAQIGACLYSTAARWGLLSVRRRHVALVEAHQRVACGRTLVYTVSATDRLAAALTAVSLRRWLQ